MNWLFPVIANGVTWERSQVVECHPIGFTFARILNEPQRGCWQRSKDLWGTSPTSVTETVLKCRRYRSVSDVRAPPGSPIAPTKVTSARARKLLSRPYQPPWSKACRSSSIGGYISVQEFKHRQNHFLVSLRQNHSNCQRHWRTESCCMCGPKCL